MASLGHIAVGIAAGRRWGGTAPARAMLAFSALSMAPDLDVIGMAAGVPYGAPWGHRGAAHSLVIAALLGLGFAALARGRSRPAPPFGPTALVAAAVAASHGLLDAMTTGGRGVAFFWPLSTHRYFLPWRPIPVAPIGVGFLSARGMAVGAWELLVFLPLLAYALWPRSRSRSPGPS
jgi:inner membrane protein